MRTLTDEAIKEFKEIFLKINGYDLTDEVVQEYALNLMELIYIVLKNKSKK